MMVVEDEHDKDESEHDKDDKQEDDDDEEPLLLLIKWPHLPFASPQKRSTGGCSTRQMSLQ
jgi:hypothetical protein